MPVAQLSRSARSSSWVLVSLIAYVAMTTACTERQSEVVLEPTNPVELASGDSHTYELTTKANQYVVGSVMQSSVDVVVTVTAPDGERIGEFDGPAQGLERVQFETTKAGVSWSTLQTSRPEETSARA